MIKDRPKNLKWKFRTFREKVLKPLKYVPFFFCRPRLKLSEVGMFKTCLGLIALKYVPFSFVGQDLNYQKLVCLRHVLGC